MPASTTIVYRFDDEPAQTIPLRPDGTAEFTWTPTAARSHSMRIHSKTASGVESGPLYRWISVPTN
jgi:hypothetical protein